MKKLVVLLLLTFLLITGCSSVEVTKVDDDINTDALKFSKEYPLVSEDNVFEYYTYDNLIDKIENGTGVIFLAYPTCKYCDLTASLLDGISKEKEIEEISYYNIKDMMQNNTQEYKDLIKLLDFKDEDYSDNLEEKEEENNISAPIIVFVKNGIVEKTYTIDEEKSDKDSIKSELIEDFNLIYEESK